LNQDGLKRNFLPSTTNFESGLNQSFKEEISFIIQFFNELLLGSNPVDFFKGTIRHSIKMQSSISHLLILFFKMPNRNFFVQFDEMIPSVENLFV